jgi:hypothetical protein
MSNTINGIFNSRHITAKLLDQNVRIGLSKFICMSNDCIAWDSSSSRASAKVSRCVTMFERAKEKPLYFITCKDIKSLNDNVGRRVYNMPENFSGVHDEYDVENMTVAGTLCKNGRKWVLETNLETVELMRRETEYEKMNSNNPPTYFGETPEEKRNAFTYRSHLFKKDQENGSMITRGHGI